MFVTCENLHEMNSQTLSLFHVQVSDLKYSIYQKAAISKLTENDSMFWRFTNCLGRSLSLFPLPWKQYVERTKKEKKQYHLIVCYLNDIKVGTAKYA